MLRLPKLLKEDGILIFESWAEGNEKYAMAKDAKVGSCLKIWCRQKKHRVRFLVSLQALQNLLRPNELLDALTEHCTVRLGEEDAGSIGVWEDVFCINGKGVSSLQSERAQKRNNENQRTSPIMDVLRRYHTVTNYVYLFLLTSAHFC